MSVRFPEPVDVQMCVSFMQHAIVRAELDNLEGSNCTPLCNNIATVFCVLWPSVHTRNREATAIVKTIINDESSSLNNRNRFRPGLAKPKRNFGYLLGSVEI